MTDTTILFYSLLALGLVSGWFLYSFGFRGLRLPTPLPDHEKLQTTRFFTATPSTLHKSVDGLPL